MKTSKRECADVVLENRAETKNRIFQNIEAWYNHNKLHSTLDYLSQMELETKEFCIH